jgi:DNA repair protein RadC
MTTKDSLIKQAESILQSAYALEPTFKVSNPANTFSIPQLYRNACAKTERFMVITLNSAHEMIKFHVITQGLVNRTMVHPREVLRPAILDNASAIIIAHNHPSGKVEPSSEDREITIRLNKAAKIIGIPLLDHIIVSKKGYYSFIEHGLIETTDDA